MKNAKLHIAYWVALAYVFIIPIYFHHFKEWRIKRGCGWDSTEHNVALAAAAFWPISFLLETGVEWSEYQEWKEHRYDKK